MNATLKQALARQFMHPTGGAGALAGWLMARKNRERIARAVDEMQIEPAVNVLEIGSGPGVAIQEIRSRVAGCVITGVDSSTVMAKQAAHRNRAGLGDGSVNLRMMPIETYEGQDGPFDLVFTINALPFCDNPARVAARCAGWLKPGGRFIIVHQPPPLRKADEKTLAVKQQEFLDWLSAAGLEPGKCLRFPAKPNPVLYTEATLPAAD
jgi:SAM-dependent methyltransferase